MYGFYWKKAFTPLPFGVQQDYSKLYDNNRYLMDCVPGHEKKEPVAVNPQAQDVIAEAFPAFGLWLAAAVQYLALSVPLSFKFDWMKRRFKVVT